jgi:subfamily B ATP-binding cassette protein MsbA
MAVMANRVTEAVTGVKVVQGFGMEGFEIGRFREALDGMLRADLRAGRASSLAPSVMELLGAIVGSGLFLAAGYGIARKQLDPGDFTVVLFALGLLFASLRRLASQYAELQQALAAADRVFDLLDRERDISDRADAEELPPFADRIEFRGMSFSYGDENVLDGFDLSIRKGEVIALVGASGSGKSTLANLIPRFYDPTAGSLCIDGRDLRSVTIQSLRAQIGIVTQETILFDDSVRGNIAYGRDDISIERIREVATAAHATEFIDRLPDGYETMLGERGTRLSMGQRQRITIARALLKAPPILILDEATSALDTESEALVQSALDRLLEGRTAIVIAHRLSTIRRADRILVMSGGRIVEEGTHDELLERAGAYARLHQLQFRESDS